MARPINVEAREAQRRLILETAGRLFAAHGFHQTGMAAICKAVGMSPGGLCRHFGSKAELIAGIAEQERAEVLTLLELVDAAPNLHQGLVEMLLGCAAAAADADALGLSLEVAAEGARSPKVGAMVAEVYRAFTHGLADRIRRAQVEGTVSSGVDAHGVVAVLAATADGLAVVPEGASASSTEGLRRSLSALVTGVLAGASPGAAIRSS